MNTALKSAAFLALVLTQSTAMASIDANYTIADCVQDTDVEVADAGVLSPSYKVKVIHEGATRTIRAQLFRITRTGDEKVLDNAVFPSTYRCGAPGMRCIGSPTFYRSETLNLTVTRDKVPESDEVYGDLNATVEGEQMSSRVRCTVPPHVM